MEDWVKQKKADALRKKMVTPTMPNYAMMYTGDGPASESAGMVSQGGQPFQVHKGEMLQPMPEGTFVMNQRTTKQAYPSFAAGGFNPYNPGTKEAYEWNKANPTTSQPANTNPYNAGTKEAYEYSKANSTAKDITKSLVDLTIESDSTKVGSNPYNAGTKEYAEWMRVNAVPSSQPTQTGVEDALLTPPKTDQPDSVASTPVAPVQTPQQTTTTETDARTTGLNYMTDSLNQPNIASKQTLDTMSARAMQERSAADQRAAQTGVTGTQARVEGQMLRNQQESELNATAADLAASDQTARLTTAGNLASTGLAGQQFEDSKARYGDTKAWTDFEYTAQYGSDADVIAAYKTATGKDLDPAAVAEIRGYARTKRAQDVTQGQLTLDAGQLANEATRLGIESSRLDTFIKAVNNGSDLAAANAISGLNLNTDQYNGLRANYAYQQDAQATTLQALQNQLGDEQWKSVQTMIDDGADLKTVNARIKAQGGTELTADQYSSILDATPLGERNWGRKVSAANMLLTNGQFDKAAEAYNEVFPGSTFDFTTLKTQQQADNFSNGMSTLAGYIAANMDQETAVAALNASGVLKQMGISTVDAAVLYDSMKVNALDEEWDAIEESKTYQALSPDEKQGLRDLFEAKLLGKLDYTTLHEYELTAPDGTVTTIYGKDQTEADKAAAKIPGTKVKDTGNVQYQMASTINTTPTDTPKTLKEGYDKFVETLPSGITFTYKEWEEKGKPADYDLYKKGEKPVQALDSITVEKYSDLLTKDNSETLFKAYAEDPDALKKSEYWANPPTTLEIQQTDAKSTFGGTRTSTPIKAVTDNLSNNIGKMIEFPDASGPVVGQLMDYTVGPASLTAQIKKPDGTIENYVLFTVKFFPYGNGVDTYTVYGKEYT